MAKFMIRASYSAAGARGLMKEGALKRRQAAEGPIRDLGGQVEAFYFALGDDDAVIICDLPDNVSVAAVALAVNASGAVSTKTTVLLTAEEMEEACRKTVDYAPPGSS